MKKFKLLSIVMVLVLLVSTFAGCGDVKLSKLYNIRKVEETMLDNNKTFTTANKLSYEDRVVESFGDILVFESTTATSNVWTFYNCVKGQVIHTETQPEEYECGIEYVSCGEDNGVFCIGISWLDGSDKVQYRISVYDLNGNRIFEETSDKESIMEELMPVAYIDVIKIGDDFYRLNKEGVFAKFKTFADASIIPEFYAKNGKNYYAEKDGELFVFDENLTLKFRYVLPEYAEYAWYHIDESFVKEPFVMENGDVIVQYAYETLETDENYTIFDDSESAPYILKTVIIDQDTGKTKEVELDYIISEIYSKGTKYAEDTFVRDGVNFEVYNRTIGNIASIIEIQNKRYDREVAKFVTLKNNGKINEDLSNLFAGQYTHGIESQPVPVAVDRYAVENFLEQELLINEKGYVVGDITGNNAKNLKYIVMNDGIYDYNLNKVSSCEDYALVDTLRNSFVFKKTTDDKTKYYLFNEGEFKFIADSATAQITSSFRFGLMVKNISTGKISVYNESLVELLTTKASLNIKPETSDKSIVFSGYNADTEKYETYIVK